MIRNTLSYLSLGALFPMLLSQEPRSGSFGTVIARLRIMWSDWVLFAAVNVAKRFPCGRGHITVAPPTEVREENWANAL